MDTQLEDNENFLNEGDFTFQPDNQVISSKLDSITDYTSQLMLDMSDEDIDSFKQLKVDIEELKESLFDNSIRILDSSSLDDNHPKKIDLYNRQGLLLDEWESNGFTRSFFHQLFQCEMNTFNDELSSVDKERCEILTKILKEQLNLIVIFNVFRVNHPNLITDIGEYL